MEYIRLNSTPDITLVTLWEVHKAVVRVSCIQLATRHKKMQKVATLEASYWQANDAFQRDPTKPHRLTIDKARCKLDLLLVEAGE